MVGASYSQLTASPQCDFAIGEVSFEDQGRARVMGVDQGLLRIYGERGTGRLLGAEMIGPSAEHLAHLLAWAIEADLTTSQALQMPFYHPVVEEGVRTALRELAAALETESHPAMRSLECADAE